MKLLACLAIFFFGNQMFASELSDYYQLVNEAELLICDGKPSSAIAHYDKAFTLPISPFGKDVFNAWICAYTVDDTTRFSKFSAILIRRGAFMHEFTHENVLNQVPIGPKVAKYSAIWRRLKAAVPSEVDTVYRQQLVDILDRDQEVRRYFIDKYKGQYNIGGRDSLNAFDSLNISKLKELMIKKGFPTEDRVGFANQYPGNPVIYHIPLMHDRSWTNRQTLDTLLYQKVLAGEYAPQDYGALKDESYSSFYDSTSEYQVNSFSFYGVTYQSVVIGNTLYLSKLTKNDTTVIDEARRSIYLEPMKEMYVKLQYQFTHAFVKFCHPHAFTSYSGQSDQFYEQIKSNSISKSELDGFNNISKQRCKYGLHH